MMALKIYEGIPMMMLADIKGRKNGKSTNLAMRKVMSLVSMTALLIVIIIRKMKNSISNRMFLNYIVKECPIRETKCFIASDEHFLRRGRKVS